MNSVHVRTGLAALATLPLLLASGTSNAATTSPAHRQSETKKCSPYAARPVRFDASGVHMVLGAGSTVNKQNTSAVTQAFLQNTYSIDGKAHVVYTHLYIQIRHASAAATSSYRTEIAAHSRKDHNSPAALYLTVGKKLLGYKYDMRAVVKFDGTTHVTEWRNISRCG